MGSVNQNKCFKVGLDDKFRAYLYNYNKNEFFQLVMSYNENIFTWSFLLRNQINANNYDFLDK